MGTVAYMSPEQIRGEKLDARSDLFSFGLVLYEMATMHKAFSGPTAPVLRDAILHRTPPAARELNAEVPHKLEQIIAKAMEKDPESRYQSASEMGAALKGLKYEFESAPADSVAAIGPDRAVPRAQRTSRWRGVAAASLILLAALTAFTWFAKSKPSSPTGLPALRQRQLTSNTGETPIRSGALSSDGKYLA